MARILQFPERRKFLISADLGPDGHGTAVWGRILPDGKILVEGEGPAFRPDPHSPTSETNPLYYGPSLPVEGTISPVPAPGQGPTPIAPPRPRQGPGRGK